MITWRDFKLFSAQTTIFTSHDLSFNSSKILATLLTKFKDKYNGEMNVFPQIPQGMPINIPQIVLKSGDGFWQLAMSPVRIDSIWLNIMEEGQIENVRSCAEALKEYLNSFSPSVVRMALVTGRLCQIDDPAKELVERFCNQASQEGPFVRSRAFEIHNYKVYKPNREKIDCSLNSWVRCKAVDVPNKGKAIVVENDLNTVENEPSIFSAEQAGNFFSGASLEIEEIVQKYFG